MLGTAASPKAQSIWVSYLFRAVCNAIPGTREDRTRGVRHAGGALSAPFRRGKGLHLETARRRRYEANER